MIHKVAIKKHFSGQLYALCFFLVFIAGILIYFEKGGAAQFDILGQEFSSTNVGLAFLVLAIIIFIFLANIFRSKPSVTSDKHIFMHEGNMEVISWDQVLQAIDDLVKQVTSTGGFRPDLIVGLCGGGLLVADLLSKRLGHVPCLALWANRHVGKKQPPFEGRATRINQIKFDLIFKDNAIDRVLIVDDVVYSGDTLSAAVAYITKQSLRVRNGQTEIKTACLFSLRDANFKPDFYVISDASKRKMLPVSDRLR